MILHSDQDEVTQGLAWLRDKTAGFDNLRWCANHGEWEIRHWVNSRTEAPLCSSGHTVLAAVEAACAAVLADETWTKHAGGWS